MVLLSAAVCSKAGKAVVARQFVEMTRMRIEALLDAFPNLMNTTTGKQHTFVETNSIRYVYQPLGELYMVLLTTKNSNILEDLETLGLFSQVIRRYCSVLEKSEISEHGFDLIFAFDEIVALGYREDVTPTQVLTFTKMHSLEEEEFLAKRRIQEREASAERAMKARELEQARRDAQRAGNKMLGLSSSNMTSTSGSIIADTIVKPRTPKAAPIRPIRGTSSKALKLHHRGNDVDNFVNKLKSEGVTVMPAVVGEREGSDTTTKTKGLLPSDNDESVHLCVKETMSLTCGRDGGLVNMEVLGKVAVRVTEEKNNRIRLIIDDDDSKGIEMKTHPNMDKELFTTESVIAMKNPENSFPLNKDVLVLKWRLQTTDKSLIPLIINCWPSEGVSGCDVIMEYELQEESLELNDVVISIPVPTGVGAPLIGDLDGECEHDRRKNLLMWRLPIIDADNKSGCLEFNVDSQPDDFFPINVSFVSKRNYCNVQVTKVNHVDGDTPVRFSSETSFVVDKYEIL